MKKSLAVLVTAALAFSVFAALPADAKKKKKKPKPCATYVAGELGAGAETLVVTDAATAEAPATHAFTLAQEFTEGIAEDAPTETLNIQVDSKAKTAGLYITFEFGQRQDYDLFVRWPDGSQAAASHGFQPLIEANAEIPVVGNPSNTGTNHAAESTDHSENIIGLITPDCGGYTVQFQNYFGQGGDFEAKIWLGEGTTEPLAPGTVE